MTSVRAYLAMSLDGYVAGPEDDLAWLEPRTADQAPVASGAWARTESTALGFDEFLADVGVILMGRRTYDVVLGLGEWPYGDVPMLVATHRPLAVARPSVTPIEGDLADVISRAAAQAKGKDVYIDGAAMVREALERDMLDSLVLTMIPTVLGGGISLFDGIAHAARLTTASVTRYGDGAVQLHLVPEGR